MDLGLDGKVAIVTGGTQGIGKATVLRLAAEGAHVVICARGQELLDATVAQVREAGGRAHAVAVDVARPDAAGRIVDEAMKAFGRIDILVNNAGTSNTGAFESVTDETWQSDFDLKLFGAIRLIRLAVPRMKEQGGGRIINVTNIGAKQPSAGSMPTTVTRAAGLAMTKALSKEFAPHGILKRFARLDPEGSGPAFRLHVFRALYAGGEPQAGDDADMAGFHSLEEMDRLPVIPSVLEVARQLLGMPNPDVG